jgi:hypothetical protein
MTGVVHPPQFCPPSAMLSGEEPEEKTREEEGDIKPAVLR